MSLTAPGGASFGIRAPGVTMRPADSCAAVADHQGEDHFATAPAVQWWLGIEHPGAWHRDPFDQGFDPCAGEALKRWAQVPGARCLALRRPPGSPQSSLERNVLFCASRCDGTSSPDSGLDLFTTTVGHESELLSFLSRPPGRVAASECGFGPADHKGSIYLVCTHAGRDGCCGRDGRPVAAALAQLRPGHVWECSHLGGHRFAANVLVLPSGTLYGRVTPTITAELADSVDRNALIPAWYRGRATLGRATQAAEHFLRRELGLWGLDDVRLDPDDADTDSRIGICIDGPASVVLLVGDHQRWRVGVAPVAIGERAISCGTATTEDPGSFRLDFLRRLGQQPSD